MIRISPSLRLSVGLAFLTASVLLLGDFLGLVPNRSETMLDARKKVCESLAVQLSLAVARSEHALVRDTVEAFVERNSDVLSAAMRTVDGTIIAQAGHHSKHWTPVSDTASTPTQVKVPVFEADKRWGSVEISFAPLSPQGPWGMLDSVYGLAIFVAVGGFVGYVFILRRALRELDPASVIPERVKVAFDTLAEGVLILDEKEQIMLANRAFAEKIGRPVSLLIGHKAADLNWSSPEGKLQTQELPWIKALKQGHTQMGIPLSLKLPDKGTRIFSVNGSPIFDNRGLKRGVLATFDDITEIERKNTELHETVTKLRDSEREVRLKAEELHLLATRDPLTGCFNRRSFFDAFESLFLEAKRDKLELSCIMTDIDHFKSVNDTHGHAVGDEAIKFMAETLSSTSRSHDIVGRYGGEEFCLLLPGLNSEEASAVAERIRVAVQRESSIRFASALSFTASFGVSTLSDGAQSPKELIENADQALYRAKRCGRNRVIRWPINQDSGQAGDTAVDRDTHGSCLAPNPVATKDQGNTDVPPFHLDEVSGLPPGLLFYNRVVYAIAQGQRYNKVSAFLSLRIDEPKHPSIVDEEICNMVSSRLTAILRRTDVVANLGIEKFPPMVSPSRAHEFGILLTELDNIDSVTWVVKRILDKLSEPVSLSDDPLFLTTSIGISVYPHDGDTPEVLIANGRAARERATSMGGRTRYQFFSRESNERAWNRMRMENQLCRAIDNDELELHYQPKVHMATRKITGFEALVRWDHPQRGLLSPDEFIALAENTGLIAPLGKWVLHTACRQAREWLTHFPDIRVAVNLSAAQFHQANICREVQGILEATGLEPRHLELEITETAIMRDVDKAALTLRDLATLGVKITIDDFGTGYSSLSYLRAFPVDSFKIDRSFLQDLPTGVRAKALYTAIAAMAKSLGLQVVAEGVETQKQLDFVRQAQCDEVQGYFISKPIAGDDATKLLMQHISGSHIRFAPRRSSIGQTHGSLVTMANGRIDA